MLKAILRVSAMVIIVTSALVTSPTIIKKNETSEAYEKQVEGDELSVNKQIVSSDVF